MNQLPQKIWKAIADNETLETPWAKTMFNLPEQEVEAKLAETRAKLENEGVGAKVAGAYLEVLPLLREHKAIQAFLRKQNNPGLAAALPEVTTPREAALLMQRDRMLDENQTHELQRVLDPKTTLGRTAGELWSIPRLKNA